MIKSKRIINLLGYDLTFYDIEELDEHDMILGEHGLRQIKATLNFLDYKLFYELPKNSKNKLHK